MLMPIPDANTDLASCHVSC